MAEDIMLCIGHIKGVVEGIAEDVGESKKDVKELLSFQSKTEERLKQGSVKLQDHEERIDDVEQRPKMRPWLAYSLIVVGFALLSFLVAVK